MSSIGIDKNWRTEEDLRTLLKAREIQKDKARMAAVKKMAAEKSAELKNLQTNPDGDTGANTDAKTDANMGEESGENNKTPTHK